MHTLKPRSNTDPNITVADVLEAARQSSATEQVVVATLRHHLNLPVLAISHALGIDANQYCGIGMRKSCVAEAAALWETVQPSIPDVTIPDPKVGWETGAACAGHAHPDMWFCDDENCEAETDAINICVTCPVIGHCALAGLHEEHGLWGGLTKRGRRDLRRHLRVRVVEATPGSVAPFVAAMAGQALKVRTAARKPPSPTFTPDGRLFPVPPATTVAKRVHRRRKRAALPTPLFVVT